MKINQKLRNTTRYYSKRLEYNLKRNIPTFVFTPLAILSAIILFEGTETSILRTLSTIILGVFCLIYYLTYFRFYLELDQISNLRRYYFDVFDSYFVLAISVLYIFITLPSILLFFNSMFLFLDYFGREPTHQELFWFNIREIANTLTLDFFNAFDIEAAQVKVTGYLGQSIVFIFRLVVDLALVAAIIRELRFHIKLNSKISRMPHSDESWKKPRYLNVHVIDELLKLTEEKSLEKSKLIKILGGLIDHPNRYVDSAVLQIFRTTRDSDVEAICIKYINENGKSKFKKAINKMNINKRRKIANWN